MQVREKVRDWLCLGLYLKLDGGEGGRLLQETVIREVGKELGLIDFLGRDGFN